MTSTGHWVRAHQDWFSTPTRAGQYTVQDTSSIYSNLEQGYLAKAYQLEGFDEVEATVGGHDVLCQDDSLGVLVGTVLANEALHVLLNAILGLLEDLRMKLARLMH